jgi:hypothetical protein
MKKYGLILVIILLAGIIATYLFLNEPRTNVHLIKIKGISDVCNYTKNYLGFSLESNDDSITATPATENDMIMLSDNLIYQFRERDGEYLKFRQDSIQVFLNDTLFSVMIENGKSSATWLKTFTLDNVRHLRFIQLVDSIPDDYMPDIKRLSESALEATFIVLANQNNFLEVLKTAKHIWLFADDSISDLTTKNAIYDCKNIELMSIRGDNLDVSRLSGLPRLKTLMISDLDSAAVKKLSKLPDQISSLEIFGSDAEDLNFLESNGHLKELNLISCNSLNNIASLKSLKKLKILSLLDCDSIADLSPLFSLNNLIWLAPPWNIQENDLRSIVENSPDLESLVLWQCKYLNSLNSLKQLDRLAYLSMVKTPVLPDSLIKFQNLKYLAYHFDKKTDSLSIKQLERQMPNTLVIPAEPFCMGTGWLLLFFAFLMVASIAWIAAKK